MLFEVKLILFYEYIHIYTHNNITRYTVNTVQVILASMETKKLTSSKGQTEGLHQNGQIGLIQIHQTTALGTITKQLPPEHSPHMTH